MIRNLEDKNMKYTYAVTDNYDDKTTVLTTKTIELKPGASAHQQQSITVQAAGKRQKISVVLIDQKETISFWIAAD